MTRKEQAERRAKVMELSLAGWECPRIAQELRMSKSAVMQVRRKAGLRVRRSRFTEDNKSTAISIYMSRINQDRLRRAASVSHWSVSAYVRDLITRDLNEKEPHPISGAAGVDADV